MDEASGGNWSLEDFGGDDVLFGLDSQSLFRPDGLEQSLGGTTISDTPSPLTAFSSVDSDVFDPVFPVDQELGLLDSGYISSNSSDSGNHSPNSTESCEQGVPWMFPEPVRHQQEHPRQYPVKGNTPPALIYAGSTPRHTQNGFYTQTVSPPPSATPVPQKKVIYVLPTTVSAARPQAVPLTPFSVGNPAVISTTPIYISQTTGNQLQPISIAPSSSQTFAIVGPDPEKDEMIRRNEDRKAKNRMSAQISRNKRRNEMEESKQEIARLRTENERLTAENEYLKGRLAKYEGQRTENGGGPSRKRAAVAGGVLMALFVMVTAGPFRIEDTTSPVLRVPPFNNTRIVATAGRVLNPEVVISEVPLLNGTSCSNKKNYNSTETIRLNNDLYEWVDRHQTMGLGLKGGKRMLLQKKQKEWVSSVGNVRVNVAEEQPESNRTRKEPVKKPKGDRLWRHLDMISVSGASAKERREKMKQMMKGGKQTTNYNQNGYERLTAAIQQKEDTLYVVALEDYFLLPALERNFTSQPRLTLILPALSLNSTVDGKVPLMRIDLRVVGTGLFNLSRQLLPLFLQ